MVSLKRVRATGDDRSAGRGCWIDIIPNVSGRNRRRAKGRTDTCEGLAASWYWTAITIRVTHRDEAQVESLLEEELAAGCDLSATALEPYI